MKKIVIESLNEVSHVRIVSILRENEISYSERILMDKSFPSVNMEAYGELMISIDDEKKLEPIFTEIPRNDYRITLAKHNSLNQKYIRIGLIVYSTIVTLLFFKYWHITHQSSIDKNFHIGWNYNNQILTYTDKKNGAVVSRFKDANYDNNYEIIESYSQEFGPISISYDLDENGYYEDIVYYDLKGNEIGTGKDYDSDGLYEYNEMILEGGDTLKFTDKNKNGVMERAN